MRRSKPVTWDQIRVGLVLLTSLVILSLGVFFIGDIGDVFGTRYRLVTLMESAAGLVPGAPVQVAGQNAGQVDRIEFINPEDRPLTGEAVAVWLAVNVEIRDQVRSDSRARVRTQGLLGDRLIDIEPGSADQPVLLEGDTLAAAPALNYQELLGQAADAVQNLTALAANLSAVTDSLLIGEGALGQMLVDDRLYRNFVELSEGLNEVIGPVSEGRGFLGRLIQEDTLYHRLVSATEGLDSLTSALVSGSGTLGRLVQSDSLYRALSSSATRTDSLLARFERGDGSLGRLITDEALYEELLRTMVDLNALLQDLREDPKRFIPPIRVF
jgi:phospholipid/cholesterol/gamma-HCH transport system substrate-binding protein